MKVIVDCDSGNDDAWAIISLLRAEHKSNYKIIALTCVNGNTTVNHSALNNLLILETLNRLDLPVYRGAESSLIKLSAAHYEPFHGIDGFGMVYEKKPDNCLVREKHAVPAMKDYIEEVCLTLRLTLPLIIKLDYLTECWQHHHHSHRATNQHRFAVQASPRNISEGQKSLHHGRQSLWSWERHSMWRI